MKTLNDWLERYAAYHKNPVNIVIHMICVPLIFWSLLGVVWSIPAPEFLALFPRIWVKLFILLGLWFYWQLSEFATLLMLLVSIACLFSFYLLRQYYPYPEFLIYLFFAVFIVAWLGQLIGHKIEGKKTAFIQDLFFLLIGPVWVLKHLGLLQK